MTFAAFTKMTLSGMMTVIGILLYTTSCCIELGLTLDCSSLTHIDPVLQEPANGMYILLINICILCTRCGSFGLNIWDYRFALYNVSEGKGIMFFRSLTLIHYTL